MFNGLTSHAGHHDDRLRAKSEHLQVWHVEAAQTQGWVQWSSW